MLRLALSHQVHMPAWAALAAVAGFFVFEIVRAGFAAHERDLYSRLLDHSLAQKKTHGQSIEVLQTAIEALAGAGGGHAKH